MSLDAKLLEILACPEDKGPLLYFEADGFLYNPRLRRKYRVDDGVPQLLIDEGVAVDVPAHDALLAQAERDGLKPNF